MFTLKSCIDALEKLPPEVFSISDNTIWYRGTPILRGALRYCLTKSEGVALMENAFLFEDFTSTDKTKLFLLHYIWVKECKLPPIFFKNGNLRTSTITKLRWTQTAATWNANTPLLQYILTEIKTRWNTLPAQTKEQLLEFCDEEGNYIRLARIYILQGATFDYHRVNVLKYKPCNNLIRRSLGELYVPKTSPTIKTETIKGETLPFTQEEWTWFNSHYIKCSTCETWTHKEETVFGLCETCTPSFPSSLAGYSERATEFFQPAVTKSYKYSPHLLGIELEYEQKPSSLLKETLFLLNKSLDKHAIFKRDGSLKNGVEICTRPASIDIHLEEFTKLYNDPLIWERLEVKSTCGMHVHIDRRKMTALTLGKLINFIQQKENQSFIETIAERASNNYSILGNDLAVTSHHRGAASTNRYYGLNTTNQNTAELRIFKTPATFEVFQKNIEFASALTTFVHPANSGIKDTNYGAFLKYVSSNSSTYKELHKFHKKNF